MPVRRALHAGSWYTDSASELSRQLEYWLGQADLSHGPARAIIAPHAGYQYCGACGGHAYRQVSPVVVKRVFILGPSHRVRLSGCALSSAQKYKTPLYDLHVDMAVNGELDMTGQFEWMDLDTDENEHSIEMHLPYIAKVMENYKNQFTIIPLLVGSLSPDREACYGRILASYLADPKNLFVISSDFCHWGHRFRYTYYDPSYGNIHQSIEGLDRESKGWMCFLTCLGPGHMLLRLVLVKRKRTRELVGGGAVKHVDFRTKKLTMGKLKICVDIEEYERKMVNIVRSGMNIIENLNPTEFTNYLKKYGNTICGRHPIGILLQAIQEVLRNDRSQSASLKFLKYAQSSQCRNMNDSSVSYASAALVID